jgi:hypothetical protein
LHHKHPNNQNPPEQLYSDAFQTAPDSHEDYVPHLRRGLRPRGLQVTLDRLPNSISHGGRGKSHLQPSRHRGPGWFFHTRLPFKSPAGRLSEILHPCEYWYTAARKTLSSRCEKVSNVFREERTIMLQKSNTTRGFLYETTKAGNRLSVRRRVRISVLTSASVGIIPTAEQYSW